MEEVVCSTMGGLGHLFKLVQPFPLIVPDKTQKFKTNQPGILKHNLTLTMFGQYLLPVGQACFHRIAPLKDLLLVWSCYDFIKFIVNVVFSGVGVICDGLSVAGEQSVAASGGQSTRRDSG